MQGLKLSTRKLRPTTRPVSLSKTAVATRGSTKLSSPTNNHANQADAKPKLRGTRNAQQHQFTVSEASAGDATSIATGNGDCTAGATVESQCSGDGGASSYSHSITDKYLTQCPGANHVPIDATAASSDDVRSQLVCGETGAEFKYPEPIIFTNEFEVFLQDSFHTLGV